MILMKSKIFLATVAVLLLLGTTAAYAASTRVPGHNKDKYDVDQNGVSDAGVYVNGHYTSVFAYQGEYGPGAYPQEEWYWDLGDGRVYGTVDSVDELDEETRTVCNYVVNYRADFGNDPYMNDGWIQNHINCKGYDDNDKYNYLIVSENDPRYTGNPEWAEWGTWEYHVNTQSHRGNLVRVMNKYFE